MWTTTDELKFIRMLGHHRPTIRECPVEDKRKLLEGYLEGTKLRHYWGSLDRAGIIEFAKKKLRIYVGLTTPRKVD